jgi:uncharacterized protein DUF3617
MTRMSIMLAIVLTPVLQAQTLNLKPGQYEIVSAMSMAGQPTTMPSRKDLHCYTAQEVENLAATLSRRDPRGACKVLNSSVAGSKLTFTTECANPDGTKLMISGDVTFKSRESYHSVVNMKQTAGPPSPFQSGMTVNIDATRIGECAK